MATDFRLFDHHLETVALVDYRREAIVDIKTMLVEIDIFEDLFSNTLSASLVINDANGLIERFPIVGDEYVIINLKTPTLDETIDIALKVYKITDRKYTTEKNQTYTIHLTSDEMTKDMISVVDEPYTGYAHDVIRNVFKRYFFNPARADNPEVVTSPAAYIQHDIGVGRQPLEFINHVANEAQSIEYPASNFLFYQDRDNYNFVTVDELISREPIDKFYFADQAVEPDRHVMDADRVEEYQKIIGMSYESNLDTLRALDEGYYSSSMLTIDPFTKTTSASTYQYERDFYKTKRLGKYSAVSERSDYNAATSVPHEKFIASRINNNDWISSRITADNDRSRFFPTRRQNFALLQQAAFTQLNTARLNVHLSGNSKLKVGDVIQIYIPMVSYDDDYSKIYNLFFSGDHGGENSAKFLITSVNNRVNFGANEYTTTLEVVKNAFDEPAISEAERFNDF